MEQQATQNQNKKGGQIASLLSLIPLIIAAVYLLSVFGITGGGTAKSEAEKYVKSDVYASLGVVPQYFKSEIIYKDGAKRLVEVKYGLLDRDWDGTYCVYLKGKNVISCTTMMGAGYNFREHLEEVKALFGL